MLNNIITMFDGMEGMLRKLKKASYEENMREFRRRNGPYFLEMTKHLEKSKDKKKAAMDISLAIIKAVKGKYEIKGRRIRGTVQTDLNLFVIYYVFPSILMMETDHAKLLADALCMAWGKSFFYSEIKYTDYDTLYNSFREKIFGIF